jgi:hypothetical protein
MDSHSSENAIPKTDQGISDEFIFGFPEVILHIFQDLLHFFLKTPAQGFTIFSEIGGIQRG